MCRVALSLIDLVAFFSRLTPVAQWQQTWRALPAANLLFQLTKTKGCAFLAKRWVVVINSSFMLDSYWWQ
jgi:hypothetical protein